MGYLKYTHTHTQKTGEIKKEADNNLQITQIITSPAEGVHCVPRWGNNRNALLNEHLSRAESGGSWKVKQVALS